jgi:hypothetical protein
MIGGKLWDYNNGNVHIVVSGKEILQDHNQDIVQKKVKLVMGNPNPIHG